MAAAVVLVVGSIAASDVGAETTSGGDTWEFSLVSPVVQAGSGLSISGHCLWKGRSAEGVELTLFLITDARDEVVIVYALLDPVTGAFGPTGPVPVDTPPGEYTLHWMCSLGDQAFAGTGHEGGLSFPLTVVPAPPSPDPPPTIEPTAKPSPKPKQRSMPPVATRADVNFAG